VAEAVDHARGPERNPRHLDRPQRDADEAEQREADEQIQRRAQRGVRRVEVALDPVVRAALAVLLDRLAIGARFLVQLDALPEHGLDALDLRAVRIFLGLDLGVVLAVDRRPFLGDHRGRKPRPETEGVRQHRVEVHRAMRLRTMQVQRHGEDGELRGDQEIDREGDPAGLQQATGEEIEQCGHDNSGAGAPPFARRRGWVEDAVPRGILPLPQDVRAGGTAT
jgi:hypothetical protein